MVAHTFNHITSEVQMGSDMAGWREEYKAVGDRNSGLSLRFHKMAFSLRIIEKGYPIWCEEFAEVRTSGWLLCFSDTQGSFIC